MKKTFLIILLNVFAFAAFAQVGIKGGFNLSNIAADKDQIDDKQTKIGWQVGLMAKLPANDWFAIQPEVSVVQKGADYSYTAGDVESKMLYFEVPVMAMVNPLGGPLNVHIGPHFSWLANVEYEYTNGLFGSEGELDDDRDNYETFDIGLGIGAGLNLKNILFELRYTQGFREIEKARFLETVEIGTNAKHFNLQLNVGCYF